MNPVLGKVRTIYQCELVSGMSGKHGRCAKFLATHNLYEHFSNAVESGYVPCVTGKVDGECYYIRDNQLLKRRDLKAGRDKPENWLETCPADNKGHRIGFMKLANNAGDKWALSTLTYRDNKTFIKAVTIDKGYFDIVDLPIEQLDGRTVELVGPKIQGNKHMLNVHCVIPHGLFQLTGFPKKFCFDEFVKWFATDNKTRFFEGIVVHFNNGELYKIHRHHLDMEWLPCKLEEIPL
jgi:hypothetical protein